MSVVGGELEATPGRSPIKGVSLKETAQRRQSEDRQCGHHGLGRPPRLHGFRPTAAMDLCMRGRPGCHSGRAPVLPQMLSFG
jgi:hypothetical protein